MSIKLASYDLPTSLIPVSYMKHVSTTFSPLTTSLKAKYLGVNKNVNPPIHLFNAMTARKLCLRLISDQLYMPPSTLASLITSVFNLMCSIFFLNTSCNFIPQYGDGCIYCKSVTFKQALSKK